MFPQCQFLGRLQTSSLEQVLRHCLSDHPLVWLVELGQLESVTLIVNRKVVDAREYYISLRLGFLEVQRIFRPHDKSAIQLRVPHSLSFIVLFGVDLVLNLHIVPPA